MLKRRSNPAASMADKYGGSPAAHVAPAAGAASAGGFSYGAALAAAAQVKPPKPKATDSPPPKADVPPKQGAHSPTAVTPSVPPSFFEAYRPTAEALWELNGQIAKLNGAIAAARAQSEAQQQALVAARDERDRWRAAAEHIDIQSHAQQRVWWGVGGLVLGAAAALALQQRSSGDAQRT